MAVLKGHANLAPYFIYIGVVVIVFPPLYITGAVMYQLLALIKRLYTMRRGYEALQ